MSDENNNGNSDFFAELESIYGSGADAELARSADDLLEGLNNEQREAVTHLDGPLLILAGAGSGKTRVITYRIAYMMKKHNVPPQSILAITFTNKAANEMRERITNLVGNSSRYIWCGTFHSIFARILRKHAKLLGYEDNFTIIDTDDQLKIVRDSMKELEVPESRFKPRSILGEISNAKNKLMDVQAYTAYAGGDYFLANCARVYKRYTEKLTSNNAMDFDDILVNMVKLLEGNPDICAQYQAKFRYIMVDEYQDTNMPQYRAVMLLAQAHHNICVVGDDDQSIYSFRGADVRLILKFEKDFPGSKVIKLEENYRSTRTILEAANNVIAHNSKRKEKRLRTSGEEGEKIIVMNADTGIDEAGFIAKTIQMMADKGKFKYSDCAVLYRMNALSVNVEKALHNAGIPFKVYGGMRFYDRKEIKDVLAYLRLINDTRDNIAFERIINVPRRGIGDQTIDRMRTIAIDRGVSLFDVARDCMDYPELGRASAKLLNFTSMIESMREELITGVMDFKEFVEHVENTSGIIDDIISQREKKGEMVDRVENLKELLSEAALFDQEHRTEADSKDEPLEIVTDGDDGNTFILDDSLFDSETSSTTEGILKLYLENAALYAEGDNFDDSDDFVRLMSIHSAKGLEFGAVFIIGAEEGVFPSYRSIQTESETEEERRLMYVAITRAKKNLFIVLAQQRMLFGQTQCNRPSRFLREISPDLLYLMGGRRERPADGSASSVSSPSRESARKVISSALSSQFDRRNDKAKKKEEGVLTPDDLTEGMKVVHPRFGEGVILKVEKVGGDALVTVDFDGMRKNMLAGSANLKKA